MTILSAIVFSAIIYGAIVIGLNISDMIKARSPKTWDKIR